MLACTLGADVINTPLNHSVVFVKEQDVVLTNDYWRLIVHYDLAEYEEAITTLHEDLTRVKGLARRTTPIGELRQVDQALSSFEEKLATLKRYLPKADRRRGWINAGGSMLKTIFGVATVWDLGELHTTVDELHRKQDEIVHSMNRQVTYFKQLDGTVKFHNQAITNLSTTLKDLALRTQEKLQEVASRLEWGDQQRQTATTIRELEFALTQLELSIDEFMGAMQYVMVGRVPVNLISPVMLQEMLKNVTLILPEGYELIIGLSPNNVYLYYEVIQTAMLADTHSFKLVLNVPLKTVGRQFELYKMVVLPTRILNNTYAQYEIGKDYFAINLLQRTYLTLTELDVTQCRGEHVRICPANQAVYNTEVNSCALSLYFQAAHAREICKRIVTTRRALPKLERHGSIVLYYLTEPTHLHLQCQRNHSWQAGTMTLNGGGILQNAESCYLTMQGLQLYPTLRGETELSAQVQVLLTPAVPAVASDREVEVMQQMSLLDGTNLEQLATSISSHHIEANINTLFHLHASGLRHADKRDWTVLGLILAGAVLTLFTLCYFTRSYIWNLLKTRIVGRGERANDGMQEPREENLPPSHPDPSDADGEVVTNPTPQVRYSVYPLQSV
jgi:hypothetical protein